MHDDTAQCTPNQSQWPDLAPAVTAAYTPLPGYAAASDVAHLTSPHRSLTANGSALLMLPLSHHCPGCTHAGAPPSNATFTCDVRAGLCFFVSARSVTATYFNARAACTTLGGDLVMYNTAEKQSFVESYLAGQGTLPKVGCAELLLLALMWV
jgi:hypothetical protein